MRHRRRKREPMQPFTTDEDRRLADMVTCGLDSAFWKVGLPHRAFGEMAERAYQLSIPRAPLI